MWFLKHIINVYYLVALNEGHLPMTDLIYLIKVLKKNGDMLNNVKDEYFKELKKLYQDVKDIDESGIEKFLIEE
jgi:hypothetical protein